jgi:hypothetical protein
VFVVVVVADVCVRGCRCQLLSLCVWMSKGTGAGMCGMSVSAVRLSESLAI